MEEPPPDDIERYREQLRSELDMISSGPVLAGPRTIEHIGALLSLLDLHLANDFEICASCDRLWPCPTVILIIGLPISPRDATPVVDSAATGSHSRAGENGRPAVNRRPDYSDPAYSDPGHADPAYADPATGSLAGPLRTGAQVRPPAGSPNGSGSPLSSPAYSGPAYSGPGHAGPAYSDPAYADPAYADPPTGTRPYVAPVTQGWDVAAARAAANGANGVADGTGPVPAPRRVDPLVAGSNGQAPPSPPLPAGGNGRPSRNGHGPQPPRPYPAAPAPGQGQGQGGPPLPPAPARPPAAPVPAGLGLRGPNGAAPYPPARHAPSTNGAPTGSANGRTPPPARRPVPPRPPLTGDVPNLDRFREDPAYKKILDGIDVI